MMIVAVTYLVRDYDEAIRWFVDVLGFKLVEDTILTETKRWVRVASPLCETSLLLAKADGPQQQSAVGNAAGGRVAFFLHTNNFQKCFDRMLRLGVKFRETPRQESYGRVVVFEDLYGNSWDLIEPIEPH